MADYVGLLRGVNVGRAKRIAMADLRGLFEGVGYTNVQTLLNSGNVVFSVKSGSPSLHASTIEREISERLSLQVPTVVVRADEFDAIVEENPLTQAVEEPSKFLVAFVQRGEALAQARGLLTQSWEPEALVIGRQAAYLWCPLGLIKSEVAHAFSNATGNAATTRNWSTVVKLQAILKKRFERM